MLVFNALAIFSIVSNVGDVSPLSILCNVDLLTPLSRSKRSSVHPLSCLACHNSISTQSPQRYYLPQPFYLFLTPVTLLQLNSNLTADGTPFRFGKDSNGNYGYIIKDEAGADAVIPFRSIDYGKIYTLSKTTTSLTTGTSVSLAQALPKGKYVGGWASFWSSDGTIRAVNTGAKAGVSVAKTKNTTKVEKIDGATAPIVVVDIAEDSDTITLSDTNNYYRAAAAFWVKIG